MNQAQRQIWHLVELRLTYEKKNTIAGVAIHYMLWLMGNVYPTLQLLK